MKGANPIFSPWLLGPVYSNYWGQHSMWPDSLVHILHAGGQ